MTRGFVCSVKGRKITGVAYLSSDAYLSYYGVRILEACCREKMFPGEAGRFIAELRKDNIACYGSGDDPCDGFRITWIRDARVTRKRSYDFAEYGYIYDEEERTLTVYHCGELYYRLSLDSESERAKAGYVFENSTELEEVLTYDAEKLSYGWGQPICELVGNYTLDELREICERIREPRLELDDSHLCLNGHNGERCAYGKRVRVSSNASACAMFICETPFRTGSKWDVLIQLPFSRARLKTGFKNESTAVGYIRTFVKEIGADMLLRFMEISEKLTDFHKNNRHEEMRAFLDSLDSEWSRCEWFDAGGAFSVASIRNHYTYFF